MTSAVNTENSVRGYEIRFMFDEAKGFEPALARIQNGTVQIYRGNGTSFKPHAEAGFIPGQKPAEEVCIDIDGDGKGDCKDLRIAGDQLQLLISREKFNELRNKIGEAGADFNGDKQPDTPVYDASGFYYVTLSNSSFRYDGSFYRKN